MSIKLNSMGIKKNVVEQFTAFIESMPERSQNGSANVAIICHDNPDLDCLGAALGTKMILDKVSEFPIYSTIFYGGWLSHPMNKSAYNVLEMSSDTKSIETFLETQDKFHAVILVDASATGGKNVTSTDVTPDVVIDHHDEEIKNEETLIIKSTSVASASTIVCGLINHFGLTFESPADEKVATALLLGIITDTDSLQSSHTSESDIAAHDFVLPKINHKKFARINKYPLPADYIPALNLATGIWDDNARESDGYFYREDSLIISGIGFIRSENINFGAMIADQFARLDGVSKVVILMLVDADEKICLSANVRTSLDTINTHEFCQRVFGKDYSGAKQGAGGAFVALEDLGTAEHANDEDRHNLFRWYFKKYKDKILKEHTK